MCIVYCVLFNVYCVLFNVYCVLFNEICRNFRFFCLKRHFVDDCNDEMALVAAFCRDGNPVILRTCHAGAKRSISKTRNLLYRTYVNMGGAKHLKVLP